MGAVEVVFLLLLFFVAVSGSRAEAKPACRTPFGENMERETGIEPATNSLEGCDSTIELLPLALFSTTFIVG